MDRQGLVGAGFDRDIQAVEVHALQLPMPDATATSGPGRSQEAAHGLGGDGEEVAAVLPAMVSAGHAERAERTWSAGVRRMARGPGRLSGIQRRQQQSRFLRLPRHWPS